MGDTILPWHLLPFLICDIFLSLCLPLPTYMMYPMFVLLVYKYS